MESKKDGETITLKNVITTNTERERERDGQTDRQTERETEGHGDGDVETIT